MVLIIIEIVIPGDKTLGEKELEKITKYQDLKGEIIRMWALIKVEVLPVVVGALGTVSRRLKGIYGKD